MPFPHFMPELRLQDKVAVVTGAASGFGECISKEYTQNGAKIVAADIDFEKATLVAAALAEKGHAAIARKVDVSDSGEMKGLVDTALAKFGRIDIWVNNAGISHANRPMLEIDEASFDRLYQVNVKSLYLSAVHCVPVFRNQGGGCFINIGSTAAVRPRPGLSWYNGSKGAVNLLTKSFAVELAPENIRVNCINPAIADTPLLTTFMGKQDTPENRGQFIASIPLGRLCLPRDVANAAVFFADPASDYLTGVCLEVDGGRCI